MKRYWMIYGIGLLMITVYGMTNEEVRECSEISHYSVLDLDQDYPLMQYAATINKKSVELEDGSVWQIDPSDAHRMAWRGWSAGNDLLVIAQNTSLFAGEYKFRIYNHTKDDYIGVKANLLLSAFLDRSVQIVDIDVAKRLIFLTDGSIWSISSEDDFIYSDLLGGLAQRRWIPGDQLIVGVNDGFWSYSRPYLLINTNLDGKFVRAEKIY